MFNTRSFLLILTVVALCVTAAHRDCYSANYEWNVSDLSWSPGAQTAMGCGWWFRLSTDWFQFTFTGIDTSLVEKYLTVEMKFALTNDISGAVGLDGLIDIVVNPGGPRTFCCESVLLDNIDMNNTVNTISGPGSYTVYGQCVVPKYHVQDGQLEVRVLRHQDTGGAPPPPVGTDCPIDMSTMPPTIPANVYESDDPRKVHINVCCDDGSGGHIVSPNGGRYVAIVSDKAAPAMIGDADCSGGVDIDDVVYTIAYIFQGGPPPGDPDGDGEPDC